MDKLKYIKLENEDGSYSDSIPLAVDSDYVDVNGNTLTNELANKASTEFVNSNINNLNNKIKSLASGSPLVASSISEMIDTSKIYVNTTDGNWYYYNDSSWQIGGIYQATSNDNVVNDLVVDSGLARYYFDTGSDGGGIYKELTGIKKGETIIFRLIEYTGNPNALYIYGFKGSDYTGLLAKEASELIGNIIELTINDEYDKIRFYLQYQGIETDVNDENGAFLFNKKGLGNLFDMVYNNSKMVYNNSKFIEDIDGKILQCGYNDSITNSNVDMLSSKDLNDIVDFKTIFFYHCTLMQNSPIDDLFGLFYSITYKKGSTAGVNQYYQHYIGDLYYRSSYGSIPNIIWTPWKKIKVDDGDDVLSQLNRDTYKIFKKVVCCGDSYTAGYISNKNGTTHIVDENYAFPHYMSRASGNEYINCGVSGANSNTWLINVGGLPKAKTSGKAQAYILGLMINDSAVGTDRYLELGTESDIGTDNITYYGCYSKIIRELNAISPTAKIFVETCPKEETESTRYSPYNEAVRNIYNTYKDTYPIHLLDLAKQSNLYENSSLTNDYLFDHYTAIGYEQFAEILAKILSDYINTHVEDFQDVAFIPFD